MLHSFTLFQPRKGPNPQTLALRYGPVRVTNVFGLEVDIRTVRHAPLGVRCRQRANIHPPRGVAVAGQTRPQPHGTI